jgi:hypothetical protein
MSASGKSRHSTELTSVVSDPFRLVNGLLHSVNYSTPLCIATEVTSVDQV